MNLNLQIQTKMLGLTLILIVVLYQYIGLIDLSTLLSGLSTNTEESTAMDTSE